MSVVSGIGRGPATTVSEVNVDMEVIEVDYIIDPSELVECVQCCYGLLELLTLEPVILQGFYSAGPLNVREGRASR